MYYLKLSGFIPQDKQQEFEQTYMFIRVQIPKTCISFSITKDVIEEDIYSFISYWPLLSNLQRFEQSPPFAVLTGAFRTLGELYENTSGEMVQTLS
jgi:hypothetical protein